MNVSEGHDIYLNTNIAWLDYSMDKDHVVISHRKCELGGGGCNCIETTSGMALIQIGILCIRIQILKKAIV